MSQEKTETQRRTVTVALGGREFEVAALPMGPSKRWRQKFGQPLEIILGVLQNADRINLQNVQDLTALVQQMGGLLLGSMDILTDALFAYSAALRQEREWIEEHADDPEALAALWEVLKLAYPFGNMVDMLNRGRATIGMSSNSAGRNGASSRSS